MEEWGGRGEEDGGVGRKRGEKKEMWEKRNEGGEGKEEGRGSMGKGVREESRRRNSQLLMVMIARNDNSHSQ